MANKTSDRELSRSDRLLLRKYTQYLVPTMITYAALSLNEFVDSMLVSNLLDSDAMAIVTLGMPLMLLMSAAYALLGNGGSTVYAMAVGRRDHNTAGMSLTGACIAALIVGLLIMLPGMLFSHQLASFLCHEQRLLADYETYQRVLLLSAPLEVMILTFATFLPSAGYPGYSTAVNVIANVVNIAMDYVYIRIAGMGVEGAAWATLTGYIAAAVFIVILMAAGKVRIYISRHIRESMSTIRETMELGRPDATNQIGLSVQFAVCNRMAAAYAGANGVVAFSLCQQANSVMSIFIGAILGTAVTLMAALHGQADYRGESDVLRTSMIGQFAVSLVGTLLMFIFAPQAAALYNIKEAGQLAMAVHALRIYSLLFIPRDGVVVYYRYLKIIGLSRYSTVLSALDSFALIIPVAWIMTGIFGINGLWYTFPISSCILLGLTLVCNAVYERKSGGRLKGIFLNETGVGDRGEVVLDATILDDPDDISLLSMKFHRICQQKGLSKFDALRASMALEEAAVFVANRNKHGIYADVLVRLIGSDVEIDCRTLGDRFDPNSADEGDIEENVLMLKGIVTEIENEYILGMNSTRIIVKGRDQRQDDPEASGSNGKGQKKQVSSDM